MSRIEYTSPWKKFILTHETTCKNCPEGFGSGSIWDSGNTINTTININNGGFWGGFKMGIGNFLGGMLGGILSGLFGGFNIGTCFWGGGGGSCGCNINQLLNPNLAIGQTIQYMNQNGWWNNIGWFNSGQKTTDNTSDTPVQPKSSEKPETVKVAKDNEKKPESTTTKPETKPEVKQDDSED